MMIILSCKLTHLSIIAIRTQFSFLRTSSTAGLFVCNSRLNRCKIQYLHLGAAAICPTFCTDTNGKAVDLRIDTTSKQRYPQHISSTSAEAITRSAIIHCNFYTIFHFFFLLLLSLSGPILEYSPAWNNGTLTSISDLEHMFNIILPAEYHPNDICLT